MSPVREVSPGLSVGIKSCRTPHWARVTGGPVLGKGQQKEGRISPLSRVERPVFVSLFLERLKYCRRGLYIYFCRNKLIICLIDCVFRLHRLKSNKGDSNS